MPGPTSWGQGGAIRSDMAGSRGGGTSRRRQDHPADERRVTRQPTPLRLAHATEAHRRIASERESEKKFRPKRFRAGFPNADTRVNNGAQQSHRVP